MSMPAATPLKADNDTVNLAGQAAAAAAQDPQVQDAAQQAAMQAASRAAGTAMRATGRVVAEASHEVVIYLKKNHYSVHALSFIGGLVLTIVSGFEVVTGVFGALFDILGYITSLYSLGFGILICGIDGPPDKFPTMRAKLFQYASFMQNNSTRFLFYLFIACMEHNNEDKGFAHKLVGYYFLFIAVMHLILHINDLRRYCGSDASAEAPASNAV